jgi:hypothetical protein
MNRRDFLTRCWQTILGIPIAVIGSKTAVGKPNIADEKQIKTDICNDALRRIEQPSVDTDLISLTTGTSNEGPVSILSCPCGTKLSDMPYAGSYNFHCRCGRVYLYVKIWQGQ